MRSELARLVDKLGITASAVYGAPANETFVDSDGWTVTLRFARRRMTVPFYMGRGHYGKEPTAADVLACLASDATSVENARGFEDWCRDMGTDSDSRKALEAYKACVRTATRLRRFLGVAWDQVVLAEH